MIRLVLASLLGFACAALAEAPTDPYAAFQTFELANGLTVVLAPSAATGRVGILVAVDAGTNDEGPFGNGVAHLTEHTLFRDPKQKGVSYLDVLRREGASDCNGFTTPDSTTYQASVLPERGDWLIDLFGGFFGARPFDDEAVEKAKEEILLELKSRSQNIATSTNGQLRPIVMSEFGIDPGGLYSKLDLDRVLGSTPRLRREQVERFYRRYYQPNNMTVLVLGSFDPAKMRTKLEATFGTYAKSQLPPRQERPVHPRLHPYFDSQPAPGNAYFINYGTKYWNVSAQQDLIVHAYFEDLTLRLMQTFRTANAQTYTVGQLMFRDSRRFGIAALGFETTREAYNDNYEYVTNLIDSETLDGHLSAADLTRIRDLFVRNVLTISTDIKGLQVAAYAFHQFRQSYHLTDTPFQIFQHIRDDEFRAALAKLFQPDRRFTSLVEPPVFFNGEYLVICLLTLLYPILLGRFRWHRKLNETSNIAYMAKTSMAFTTRVVLWLRILFWMFLFYGAYAFVLKWEEGLFAYRGAFILQRYVQESVFRLILFWTLFRIYSRCTLKVVVNDKQLIVRSRFFRSWVVPRDKIVSVELLPLRQAWRRRTRRTIFAHWGFSRPGVWVEVSGGRAFYLGFADPKEAAQELAKIVPDGEDAETTGIFQVDPIVAP